MTKKDYKLIAKTLRNGLGEIYDPENMIIKDKYEYMRNQLGGFRYCVDLLMDAMREDNSNFRNDIFLNTIFPNKDK